jgi:acetylornithine/succinyldiaminopimelate/putrescine aminotransferase
MNTGAEAVETASLKLCRKWAYEVKGIWRIKPK